MSTQVQHMLEKLEQLPPERLTEVEDFIDFLQQREQEKTLRQDFSHMSADVFAKVWNNDDDAIYDAL